MAQAGGLVEHPERPQVVDVTTYYRRNQDVVDVADKLLVFQVNDSGGVQDTVDRALGEGDTCRRVRNSGKACDRHPEIVLRGTLTGSAPRMTPLCG